MDKFDVKGINIMLRKVDVNVGRLVIGECGRQGWFKSRKSVCISAICHSSCWPSG
jgi:hypothetical protein